MSAAARPAQSPLYKSLFVLVVAALIGGVLNIIQTTSFDALARSDVLQVLVFAIIFGVIPIARWGDRYQSRFGRAARLNAASGQNGFNSRSM